MFNIYIYIIENVLYIYKKECIHMKIRFSQNFNQNFNQKLTNYIWFLFQAQIL